MINASRCVQFAACLILSPVLAGAQTSGGGIAGTVKDSTGAVLPGVTVEASSPALIEKVRTAASDTTGQYKIVELPPGTYSVTFTLTGFNGLKREGIQLTTGFTATVNADLAVGQVSETVTVSGESPTVDVHNVRQATVMTREVVDTIPTGKQFQNLGALVPGMVMNQIIAAPQDVGGEAGQSHATMQIHGGQAADLKLYVDGMGIQGATAPGTNGFYFTDGNYQEFVLDVGATSAERETGGVGINMVPRDGGNAFNGSFVANFTNKSLAGTNINDDLRKAGLQDPNNVKTIWNVNPTFGGPILKDKLWFFATYTRTVTDSYVGGTYYNKTSGTPFYTPDFTRQAVDDFWATDAAARLTFQATPRNKFNIYYDYNLNCHCHFLVGPVGFSQNTPEGSTHMTYLTHLIIGTWSSPVTNRLLFEVGATTYPQKSRWDKQQDSSGANIIDIGKGIYYGNLLLGRSYYDEPGKAVRASMSYVTGAHAAKVGFSALTHGKSQLQERDGNMALIVLNGSPVAVTYYPTPNTDVGYLRPNLGVYAQDQWTLKHLTLNAGVRFDYLHQGYEDTVLPPVPNVPTTRSFPAQSTGNWKDLSPRLGAAYDLFGNGKTAIKGSVSRYVGQGNSSVNGAASALGNDTRYWIDENNNFFPDGDPTNPAVNGEIGPRTNGQFTNAFIPKRYDPDGFGWGVRPLTNWEFSAGVQHELVPRVSMNVSYFRRVFTTFQVTDNAAVGPADYDPFCVTAPRDPRLPGGGGQQLCGLFDRKPEKVGQSDPVVMATQKIGNQFEHWNGIDVTMNARLSGVLIQGGISTGKQMTDNCEIISQLPELNEAADPAFNGLTQSTQFCHLEYPFLTQAKLLGSYTLPWEVQVAATYQNLPGPVITANAVFTSEQIAPSLGRPLASGATATINVVKPGDLYGARLNQVDLRFTKIFKFGSRRLQGMFDIYNAFNGSAVLQVNKTYGTDGASWLGPQTILPARLFKFGVQVNF
jgi:Carboxypeptidase regulatory-like domain